MLFGAAAFVIGIADRAVAEDELALAHDPELDAYLQVGLWLCRFWLRFF